MSAHHHDHACADDVRGYQRWLEAKTKAIADGIDHTPPAIEWDVPPPDWRELGGGVRHADEA